MPSLPPVIRPLAQLSLSAELDGSCGTNRDPDRHIPGFNTDKEAIEAWLRSISVLRAERSYRRAVELFYLWAIFEKQKPLSSLSPEDCVQYKQFLAGLGVTSLEKWSDLCSVPQDQWIGKQVNDTSAENWRPYKGPLKESSQAQYLRVARLLFTWLTESHYLYQNPFKLLKMPGPSRWHIDTTRSFSDQEWHYICEYLHTPAKDDCERVRLHLIVTLLYSTGLMLSELAAIAKRDIECRGDGKEVAQYHQLSVPSKIRKDRRIILHPLVLDRIDQYFRLRGFANFQQAPEDAPIIASMMAQRGVATLNEPLSADGIASVLRTFFSQVATELMNRAPDIADRLRQASAHWFRHTYGLHSIAAGINVRLLSELLGHHQNVGLAIQYLVKDDQPVDVNIVSHQVDRFPPDSGLFE